MSKGQFNALRAGFYLVAFVIGAHVIAALAAEAACIYHAELIVEKDRACDVNGKLAEMLAAALAAALAFAGGQRMRQSRDDDGEEG